MVLREWPDAAFLENLDSIAKSEPLKKKPENQAEVSLPLLQSPNLKSGKKPGNTQNQEKRSLAMVSSGMPTQVAAEKFAERFQHHLEKALKDPDRNTRRIQARKGEDLWALLQRVYGSAVADLPRFVIQTQIQALNPSLGLDGNLEQAEVVLPKMR